MKSKTIICPPDANWSGIQIEYVKSRRVLNIAGWYDSFVGIQSTEISLRDFLCKLGITEADCRKCLVDAETEAK